MIDLGGSGAVHGECIRFAPDHLAACIAHPEKHRAFTLRKIEVRPPHLGRHVRVGSDRDRLEVTLEFKLLLCGKRHVPPAARDRGATFSNGCPQRWCDSKR